MKQRWGRLKTFSAALPVSIKGAQRMPQGKNTQAPTHLEHQLIVAKYCCRCTASESLKHLRMHDVFQGLKAAMKLVPT